MTDTGLIAETAEVAVSRTADSELLIELGQEFARSIDIESTLTHAASRIAEYMNAEAASVFLLDRASMSLECRACFGPVNITGLQMPVGKGIVGKTAADGLSRLVADVQSDPDFTARVDRKTGFSTRSILCTPLTAADGVIGVLQILNKRDGGLFDETDQDTLRILASPTSLAINNARMAADLVEQRQIKRELFLARRLQRSFYPRRRTDGFPVQGINLPARQVSGDFYDHFELDDGRIAFTVGDVSGKGMNAALVMVQTATLLRFVGKKAAPAGDWLTEVNNELVDNLSQGMFICAIAGYYHPATHELEWANAGFPTPLKHNADGSFETYPAMAPPLGIIRQESIAEQHCRLDAGSIYFYSDGVTEIRQEDGSMLEEEGLEALINRFSEKPLKARLGSIVTRLRRMKIIDDTTLLAIDGVNA